MKNIKKRLKEQFSKQLVYQTKSLKTIKKIAKYTGKLLLKNNKKTKNKLSL